MDLVLFTIALFILLFSGGGAAIVLLRHRAVSILELAGLSILCGSAIISISSFCLGFFLTGRHLRYVIAAEALALGAVGVALAWRKTKIVCWPLDRPVSLLFAGVLLIQSLIITWVSLRLPLGYDGLIIWELKARLIFNSGGVMPLGFYQDASKFFHPHYPLFLPLTEAWFYGWLGHGHQGLVKLISPLFYLAAVCLLYAGGARLSKRRWRGFLSAGLLFILPSVVSRVSAGEADFPLGVFYLSAVIYLLEYWQTGERASLWLVSLLGSVLPWVKQEGGLLWLCLLIPAGLIAVMRGRRYELWILALPGVFFLSAWRIFLELVNASATPEYLPVTLGTLWNNLGRGPTIVWAVLIEMMKWRSWSLLWLAPILALPLLSSRRLRAPAAVMLSAVVLPVCLYSAIYIFSAWNPFTLHLDSSLPRLLLQVSLVIVLLIGLTFPGDLAQIEKGNESSPRSFGPYE